MGAGPPKRVRFQPPTVDSPGRAQRRVTPRLQSLLAALAQSEVCSPPPLVLGDVVNLSEANSSGASDSRNYRCVITGRQIGDQGRFLGIRRRDGGIDQLLLLGILPVVVGHDGGSLRVAEIGQRASDAELRQRRPDR